MMNAAILRTTLNQVTFGALDVGALVGGENTQQGRGG